jgi:hypothetical protein
MSLQQSDDEAQAVAVAPRVSLAEIERAIEARFATTARRAVGTIDPMVPISDRGLLALELLSICVLVLKNGFTVVGKSAPASPVNFNADLGAKFAYEDCIRQLWPLMGFALRDKLHANENLAQAKAPPPGYPPFVE